MPKINMTIPHRFAEGDAVQRIRGLLDDLRVEHGGRVSDLQERWDGNTCRFSFRAMGVMVSGTLTVQNGNVLITGDLPWTAAAFKGVIESKIREHAARRLA